MGGGRALGVGVGEGGREGTWVGVGEGGRARGVGMGDGGHLEWECGEGNICTSISSNGKYL